MRDHTNETVAILAGIGIGAALMFFLDPHRNNGRRAPSVEPATEPTLHAVRDLEVASEESPSHAQRPELVDAQMR